MSDEMEIAAGASLGGLKDDSGTPVTDAACRNCGAAVEDRFCSTCGQLAANFHKPVWSLVGEGLADTFALDGRISRTLPTLIFQPGRITRNYLEGKRAKYVPPFRLFLLCSLVFFAVFFGVMERFVGPDELHLVQTEDGRVVLEAGEMSGPELFEDFRDETGRIDRDAVLRALEGEETQAAGEVSGEDTSAGEDDELPVADLGDGVDEDTSVVLDRFASVYENQGAFFAALKELAPRLALLMPLTFALMLAILYFWHRRKYVYDHLIVSLHLQSALYLTGTALILLSLVVGGDVFWLLVLGLPVYVYRLLRVTFRTGRLMAGLRTFILLIGTTIAVTMLVVGTFVLGALQV